LDLCAEALLEHETIDGKHVQEIIDFGEIRSPIIKREAPVVEVEDEAEPESQKPESAKGTGSGDLAGDSSPAGAPA
jgi:cell division protease FtsH